MAGLTDTPENRKALLAQYDEYVAQQKQAQVVSTGAGRGGGRALTPNASVKILSMQEWAAQKAQEQAVASTTPPAPGSPPNAANEAMARAGSMPATGSSGLLGFDGTTATTGAPTGYTPYLTTTDGGSVKGQVTGYKAGDEYNSWTSQNEQQRLEWKQALWYAGYYGNKKPVLNGDLAPEDISALKSAMELGNLNGKSWQDAIAPRVTLGQQQGGAYTGQDSGTQGASGAFDQTVTGLRQFAEDNGINLTEDFIGKQAKAIASGQVSQDEVLGTLRDKYVAPAYPGFAEQIRAGQSVKDLAAPYTATMAKLLEIPEGDVKVSDPSIAKAIQAVDEKGNAAHLPLWQFEQEIKKDSRYQYTSNAWNDVGQQAYKVMQMFGLQG